MVQGSANCQPKADPPLAETIRQSFDTQQSKIKDWNAMMNKLYYIYPAIRRG